MTTNVQQFIADLNAGVMEQKLGRILSDVAGAVVDHNRKGKVILEFSLERIGNSYQVNIANKMGYVRPTSNGKISEEETIETPMYVGKGGALTLFPENQNQLFDKFGQPNAHKEEQKP